MIAPLAKRLAEENGIDWRKIQGSGPDGRVIERDILNYLSRIMSGDEELPSDPVDPPPPAWEAELGGVDVQAMAQAGVDADITDFVASSSVRSAPRAAETEDDAILAHEDAPSSEAPGEAGAQAAGDEFGEDDFVLDLDLDDLEDEPAAAAPDAPPAPSEHPAATRPHLGENELEAPAVDEPYGFSSAQEAPEQPEHERAPHTNPWEAPALEHHAPDPQPDADPVLAEQDDFRFDEPSGEFAAPEDNAFRFDDPAAVPAHEQDVPADDIFRFDEPVSAEPDFVADTEAARHEDVFLEVPPLAEPIEPAASEAQVGAADIGDFRMAGDFRMDTESVPEVSEPEVAPEAQPEPELTWSLPEAQPEPEVAPEAQPEPDPVWSLPEAPENESEPVWTAEPQRVEEAEPDAAPEPDAAALEPAFGFDTPAEPLPTQPQPFYAPEPEPTPTDSEPFYAPEPQRAEAHVPVAPSHEGVLGVVPPIAGALNEQAAEPTAAQPVVPARPALALRRSFDATALGDASSRLEGLLGRVPLVFWLARAAQRHADLIGGGRVGLLDAGTAQTLLPETLEGDFRASLSSFGAAAAGSAALTVVDAGELGVDEVTLPVEGATLSLSRLEDGRASLLLSGHTGTADGLRSGAEFLRAVTADLENPIVLMV
ncbi:hypothetical protein HNR42_002611 [Deinobacterium chartae]|uniref:Peripheral subunit-binding (PSBD) domain-containing protein n=1 Tax=Deinobacterium chartae TaxID=521158 RepID=A0A841I5M8_9DEIO|nr:E3 binding domain-containing protein [Deinobacterium chartae]MBB6099175.1 hypothetical protein [Deinobacterium chartae]